MGCPEDIILWADGSWCFGDELLEMDHMSDDYQILMVDSEEWRFFLGKDNEVLA